MRVRVFRACVCVSGVWPKSVSVSACVCVSGVWHISAASDYGNNGRGQFNFHRHFGERYLKGMRAGRVTLHPHHVHRGDVGTSTAPAMPCNDVLGLDSSDDEPLVPVHKKAKLAKPVKRERSAAATVEPVVCGH